MKSLILTVVLTSAALYGCSGGGDSTDPKEVVITFFGAMEKNDQAALAHLLDLGALMQNVEEDYAVQSDEPRVFSNPQDILNDLTNDGLTKKRWFFLQRIINKSDISGDNATVEVTFVDKANSRGYRTHFGLHKMNGKWRIYSFKTFDDPAIQ